MTDFLDGQFGDVLYSVDVDSIHESGSTVLMNVMEAAETVLEGRDDTVQEIYCCELAWAIVGESNIVVIPDDERKIMVAPFDTSDDELDEEESVDERQSVEIKHKPKLTPQQAKKVLAKYRRQEADNHHIDNIIMLAEMFGFSRDATMLKAMKKGMDTEKGAERQRYYDRYTQVQKKLNYGNDFLEHLRKVANGKNESVIVPANKVNEFVKLSNKADWMDDQSIEVTQTDEGDYEVTLDAQRASTVLELIEGSKLKEVTVSGTVGGFAGHGDASCDKDFEKKRKKYNKHKIGKKGGARFGEAVEKDGKVTFSFGREHAHHVVAAVREMEESESESIDVSVNDTDGQVSVTMGADHFEVFQDFLSNSE